MAIRRVACAEWSLSKANASISNGRSRFLPDRMSGSSRKTTVPMGQVTGDIDPRDGSPSHGSTVPSGLLDLELLQHGAADLVQHAHAHRARGDLRGIRS